MSVTLAAPIFVGTVLPRLAHRSMHEPAVTLTDFAIALECLAFCVLARRWHASNVRAEAMRGWWLVLFASVGAGALLGGIVHGFAPGAGPVRVWLWRATLLALGVTALSMWNLGARLGLRDSAVSWMRRAAFAMLVAYAGIVLFAFDRFIVAIAAYLPAALFLTVMLANIYRRTRARGAAIGLAGLALSFAAAAVQQLRVVIHPVYFDHNAFYHVVQAIGLYLLFVAARWSVALPTSTRSPS